MKTLKYLAPILGFFTLIGLILMFLALTDIYNNTEPNLDLEWAIVKISFYLSLIFTITALVTFWKLGNAKHDRTL